MRRPRIAAAALGLLGALATAAPGDPAPRAPPPTLATLLPVGARAFVETDDLRALLTRWSGSKLRQRFQGSRPAADLEKSRLYLRLARNLAQLEDAAGFGLTLPRLTQIAGHRSVIAIYDVPSTSFVAVSELSAGEAQKWDWLGLRGKLGKREHRGVPYLLREAAGGRPPLALALVGSRMIAGTDLEGFRGALVLSARAGGLALAPPGPGVKEPVALGADTDLLALLAEAPADAPVRVWTNQKRLSGTHYFDDYWAFGADSARGVEQALVAVAPGEEHTVETRIYLYAEGQRPDVAVDRAAQVGHGDPSAAASALPPAPPFASARPIDVLGAREVIQELMLGAEGSDAATAALDGGLEKLAPQRALEVIEPAHPKGGYAEHHAAVALSLAHPDALSDVEIEAVLARAAGARVAGRAGAESSGGAGFAPTFSDDGKGDTPAGRVRVLRLPLLSEWALSWRRVPTGIIVATDPAACRRLAIALARPETARLLALHAPRLMRLDVERAASAWKDATRILAARDNWSDPRDAEFFRDGIGGTFDVVKDVRRVTEHGYARGPRTYVEEVQY